jgi:hypothetical protein
MIQSCCLAPFTCVRHRHHIHNAVGQALPMPPAQPSKVKLDCARIAMDAHFHLPRYGRHRTELTADAPRWPGLGAHDFTCA